MDKNKKVQLFAKLALFTAALIWGSSFITMKTTVDTLPPCYLLASRFILACIILAIIFYKKIKKITKEYLWQGAVIGFLLFAAYSVQTYGLAETTPGKNAFLTAIYCVIVPFLFWAVGKNKPDIYNVLAGMLCIGGIGLVSITGDLTIGKGDFLTLCSGFLYAGHMVFVSKFTKNKDAVLLTILQFGFSAIFAAIAAVLFETAPTVWTMDTTKSILYLAIFSTAIALLLQTVGQKYTNPSAASIILSLESVFGVMFSVLLYGEELTKRLILGFVFIFISIIVSETKLSFLAFGKKIPPEADYDC